MLSNLGSYLRGTEQRPLFLTVNGSVGTDFGTGSNHCVYVLNGNVAGCILLGSTNCRYFIEGEVGDFYYTSPLPGRTEHCVFETSNPKTYEKLKSALERTLETERKNPSGSLFPLKYHDEYEVKFVKK